MMHSLLALRNAWLRFAVSGCASQCLVALRRGLVRPARATEDACRSAVNGCMRPLAVLCLDGGAVAFQNIIHINGLIVAPCRPEKNMVTG